MTMRIKIEGSLKLGSVIVVVAITTTYFSRSQTSFGTAVMLVFKRKQAIAITLLLN
jgi:hypothetical protein